MACQNCHTRHYFSKKEAQEPQSCRTCHSGFDHAQWEMWSLSKHGSIYLTAAVNDPENKSRSPKCQTCHMSQGNHSVITPWGFFGVRGFEENELWKKDRTNIFKGLGMINSKGEKTDFYKKAVELKMFRENKKDFEELRSNMKKICERCHSKSFVTDSIKNSDIMLMEADKLFSEAFLTVSSYKKLTKSDKDLPDLLSFYDSDTKIEELLYEMFMEHRMKTFQSSFHINPDMTTWYGFAKLKKDLVEIKEIYRNKLNREQLKEKNLQGNPH